MKLALVTGGAAGIGAAIAAALLERGYRVAIADANAAALGASAQEEEEFETEEAVEMDFPARVIQLKIENDVVRTQLQALDALMNAR
jgi:NAD(P)-dependent dehydrogenase (short-subunit alcohol dehydrogenase family)